jgi:hypothetical protein
MKRHSPQSLKINSLLSKYESTRSRGVPMSSGTPHIVPINSLNSMANQQSPNTVRSSINRRTSEKKSNLKRFSADSCNKENIAAVVSEMFDAGSKQ